VLYPLDEKRVLGWVVKRSQMSEAVDTTVVAVGDAPENDAIVEFCDRENILYRQGPEENLIERHVKAINETGCEVFCRVTGDCPFVPTTEITRVVTEHQNNDAVYTTNCTSEMPIGTAIDVLDTDVIEQVQRNGESHPVKLLRENPKAWNVDYTVSNQWTDFSTAHTAVDTPADYWQLVDAVDAIGTDPLAVTKWVHEQG
jgi:spore coat polysaccharide biosynthesis protein SpsF